MAKLRVIHNMVDTRCGITRRIGEVFEVKDEIRIKELLDAKVVEEVKEKNKPDKYSIVLIVFLYFQKLMTLKDGMVLRTLTGGFYERKIFISFKHSIVC